MNENTNLTEAAKHLSSVIAAQNAEPDELYEAMEEFERSVATPAQSQIAGEIRKALALGHWRLDDIAALVASWGDTLDDNQVLEYLKAGPETFRKIYSDGG